MKVAMVKHKPYGKVFWFEIPEHLVGKLQPGFRVACNTARGRRYGTVVAADLDEQDVKEVMLASGATFPLSTIEATTQEVLISAIKIPGYMARTKPSDEKIAKRFLEFYHTGQFNTNVSASFQLGSNESRSGAATVIQDDCIPVSVSTDCVAQQINRFFSGVERYGRVGFREAPN